MRLFKTDKRIQKIIEVVKNRQYSLHIVIENIHDPHNVSAVFRTCDAVGVPKISLVYTEDKFPKISGVSSSSANKWVDKQTFRSINDCYDSLRKDGFKIYATRLDISSKNLYDINLTEKTAIVMGNEHSGVSSEAAELADGLIYIPMHGMVQSLNVSVAAAVILYEAKRQRMIKGMYDKSELTNEELEKIIDNWSRR